ncbi:MAG: hypothetical protein M3521_08515 [Acidobacteriota bacterium]|jgi:hypothetical protein|nr:hypothetical protein [Acidobacteriota bacterium]MDQ3373914.1 hypothetical protein [Acidobacteriota bacterium]
MLKKFTLIITFGFLIFTFGLSVGAQSKTSKAKKLITKTSAKTTEKNEVSPVREPPKISTKKNERPQVQNREMTDNNHLEAIEKKGEMVKTNSRPEIENNSSVYFYEFSQPNFLVSKIIIEHDEKGKGKISFLKKNFEETVSDPLQLSTATLEKVRSVWQTLNFLDSREDYQSIERDYAHLGNMKFTIKKEGRERTAKFNWTENVTAKILADEYRKISQQFVWIFDINVARENQPLESPNLMNALDGLIRRNEVSDPEQMIPMLKELGNDERIPLLARNHATKIIKQIERKKEEKK